MAKKNKESTNKEVTVDYKDFDDEPIPDEFVRLGDQLKRDNSGQFIEDINGSKKAIKCPYTQKWCKGTMDHVFACAGCKYFYDTLQNGKKEAVNHPLHYGGDTVYECIKVLKAWMSADEYRGFLRGNAIKYLCRTGKKDETIQELKKSAWYINKLIESYEEK